MTKMTVDGMEKDVLRFQAAYDQGAPLVSDEEFDGLVATLRERCPTSPVLVHLGAPVTRDTVKHSRPMLSLQKAYTNDEVDAWVKRVAPKANGVVIQPKYDGISLILSYDGAGNLCRAGTRGGGLVGDVYSRHSRPAPSARYTSL